MKTKLQIPRVLQRYCDNQPEMVVDGKTVRELLDEVKRKHPSLYECICDETGTLRRHINLFLNDELLISPTALKRRVESGDVVSVFQAVSGG